MAASLLLATGGRSLEIPARAGEKLSRAIWLSGLLPPASLCNGLALCGRCKVRYLKDAPPPAAEDERFFSAEDLAGGWRLACRHALPASGKIELELPALDSQETEPEACRGRFFLGIDLGTTTIEWSARGEGRLGGKFLNPQGGAGADVISRLAMAREPGGEARLSALAGKAVKSLIARLNGAGAHVERACLAANSAMTEILLEKNIEGLCAAPYHLSWQGAEILELPWGPGGSLPVVFPPLASPFVGGDLSCGLWSLVAGNAPRPFILADLGTNAELALLAEDALYIASLPLGPAMEGVGPACGALAGPDVASSFSLTPAGLAPVGEMSGGGWKGISATGYLSLLAHLLNLGIMDGEGHFVRPEEIGMPLARGLMRPLPGRPGALDLGGGLFLAPEDVETLLKVRAAFAAALSRLLRESGLEKGEIAGFHLAGALGQHGNMADLERLGFLPASLAKVASRAGNAALEGACLLAEKPDSLPELAGIMAGGRLLQLADDPAFAKDYMDEMKWGNHA